MPYLTIHGRLGRASLFGGIPLGIAIWYTIKIFRMDDQELLRSALDPVLALSDTTSSFYRQHPPSIRKYIIIGAMMNLI